jgi:hypothetical protein
MTACLPVLCIIAAATVDVGHLCATEAQLQNAADAAATAAVMQMWKTRSAAGAESSARADAVAEAEAIADINHQGVDTQVQFGTWDENVFTPKDSLVSVNAVRVEVLRNDDAAAGPSQTFFAHIFGVDEVEQGAVAVARFRPRGMVPFSVWEPDVVGPGQTLTLYDDNQVVNGVFGLLDFNAGENATSDLVDWIDYGYRGPLWIDPEVGYLDIQGNPGWVDALGAPVQRKIDTAEPVVACVYSNVWGGGAGTIFRVVGFLEVIVTEQGHEKVDGENKKFIRAHVNAKYTPGNGNTKGKIREFMALQLVQ